MGLIHGSEWGGSRYSLFQTCHRKYYWAFEYENTGLITIQDRATASKGTVIHAGLMHFYMNNIEGLTYTDRAIDAIEFAVNLIPTLNLDPAQIDLIRDQVIACLDQYFQHWEGNDLHVIDCEKPIDIVVAGNKYTGIRDMLGTWNGNIVVIDHKTTGLDKDKFFKKWTYNLSLRGYAYERWKATGEIHHILINGIFISRKKTLECTFERDVIFLTEADMIEFENTIQHITKEVNLCSKEGFWPKSGDQCVHIYGECDYRRLCQYPDPAMVNTFYKRRGQDDLPTELSE